MLRFSSYQISRPDQHSDLPPDRESRAEEIADAIRRAVRRGQCDRARRLDAELAMLGYSYQTFELAESSAIGGGR